MKITILKKEKGKKYESKEICRQIFHFDLTYEGRKPLGCSISDTRNYWAAAFGNCGLDIEEKGRTVKENVAGYLHPREREYLSGLSYGTSEWNDEFFRIWNCKEAVYKVLGYNFMAFSCFDDNLEYLTEIKAGGKTYYIHYFDDGNLYGCLVSEDDSFEIEYVKYAGKHAKAPMDFAMDLLAVKAYASLELKKKLRAKGYSEEDSEDVVSRLLELGYLDDEEYAKRYSEKLLASGKGKSYIKQKMMQMGLEAVEIDPDAERRTALETARSLYETCDDYESRQKLNAKIARRLASRGYSSSIVYSVIKELEKENR